VAHRAYLVIDGPGHNRTHVPLRDGITSLGRLPSNDVILQGDLVSRHHARILFFDGRASLQDLGSHNGCWVNDTKIATCTMNEGDRVRVGNFAVEFHRGEPAPSEQLELETRGDLPAPLESTRPPTREALPEGLESRDPSRSRLVRQLDEMASGEGAQAGEPASMTLLRVAEALSRAQNTDEYLTRALALIAEALGASFGAIHRPEGAGLRLVAGTHPARALEGQFSDSVLRWAIGKSYTVFSRNLKSDLRFGHGKSVVAMADEVASQVSAPIGVDGRVYGALSLSRSLANPFGDADVELVEGIARLLGTGIAQLGARSDLSRYFPPGRRGGPEKPGAVSTGTATVLAGDVQGFARLADRLSPERVADLLETYRTRVTEVLFKHEAAVRFGFGSDVIAVFADSSETAAERAVEAAIAARTTFDGMASTFRDLGPRRMRIGISTGWSLSGIIGRLQPDFAVVGDAADVAHLLVDLAPPGAILVDPETDTLARRRFLSEEAGIHAVRSRREPLRYFQILGVR